MRYGYLERGCCGGRSARTRSSGRELTVRVRCFKLGREFFRQFHVSQNDRLPGTDRFTRSTKRLARSLLVREDREWWRSLLFFRRVASATPASANRAETPSSNFNPPFCHELATRQRLLSTSIGTSIRVCILWSSNSAVSKHSLFTSAPLAFHLLARSHVYFSIRSNGRRFTDTHAVLRCRTGGKKAFDETPTTS